jgi:hypothetical protein
VSDPEARLVLFFYSAVRSSLVFLPVAGRFGARPLLGLFPRTKNSGEHNHTSQQDNKPPVPLSALQLWLYLPASRGYKGEALQTRGLVPSFPYAGLSPGTATSVHSRHLRSSRPVRHLGTRFFPAPIAHSRPFRHARGNLSRASALVAPSRPSRPSWHLPLPPPSCVDSHIPISSAMSTLSLSIAYDVSGLASHTAPSPSEETADPGAEPPLEPFFYRGRCLPPPPPILLSSSPDSSGYSTPSLSRRSSSSGTSGTTTASGKNVRFAPSFAASIHFTHSSDSYDRSPIVPADDTETLVLPPRAGETADWIRCFSRGSKERQQDESAGFVFSEAMARATVDGFAYQQRHSSSIPWSSSDTSMSIDSGSGSDDHDVQHDQDYDDHEDEADGLSSLSLEPRENKNKASSVKFGMCGLGKWSRGDLYGACDALGGF